MNIIHINSIIHFPKTCEWMYVFMFKPNKDDFTVIIYSVLPSLSCNLFLFFKPFPDTIHSADLVTFFNLFRKILWSMVSNTALKSSKLRIQIFSVSITFSKSLNTWKSAVSVLWCFYRPIATNLCAHNIRYDQEVVSTLPFLKSLREKLD